MNEEVRQKILAAGLDTDNLRDIMASLEDLYLENIGVFEMGTLMALFTSWLETGDSESLEQMGKTALRLSSFLLCDE